MDARGLRASTPPPCATPRRPREKTRAYTRVLFASAYDDIPDKQGRITIPPSLREYAGLTRECVVVGADTRIEIWDTAAWETYLTGTEQSFAELDGEVVPPGVSVVARGLRSVTGLLAHLPRCQADPTPE